MGRNKQIKKRRDKRNQGTMRIIHREQRAQIKQSKQLMEYTGKIEQMLQDAQEYRLLCYRRMLLADMADKADEKDDADYSVQDYLQERTEASENAARLLDYIDIHKNELSPKEKSELLLTAFVALNTGFRNYEQSIRATEMSELLLPILPDSRTKLYLQVYLYQEIGDESMMEEIDRLMEMTYSEEDTEEDRCLMNFYEQMMIEL